jgi:hypothetical protein
MPQPTLFYDCWHISRKKSSCLWLLTPWVCRNWWNAIKVIITGLRVWPRNHLSVSAMEITCFATTKDITPRAQLNPNGDCFLPLWERYCPIITLQNMKLLTGIFIHKFWDISALYCVALESSWLHVSKLNTFKGYQLKYNMHLGREWAFSLRAMAHY